MKNIKNITLLAFAVIGFYTIITAFSSTESKQSQHVYGTPESHVWEELVSPINNDTFIFNKVTGEVRGMGNGPDKKGKYIIMTRE